MKDPVLSLACIQRLGRRAGSLQSALLACSGRVGQPGQRSSVQLALYLHKPTKA